MKLWTSKPTGYTPLLVTPGGNKVRDLNPGTVLETTNDEPQGDFVCVTYGVNKGWVNLHHADPYIESLPKDCVYIADIQTPENDAEQYINWRGRKQVNMCGELCVALKLDCSLSAILTRWEQKQPSFFKRIFGGGVAAGTYNTDLKTMLEMFDTPAQIINEGVYKYYTPALVANLAGAIVGVRINKLTGRLNGGGIGHWVTIVDSAPERTGYGTVTVYNPFHNRHEIYSYTEFVNSARAPFGVI